MCEQDLKLGYPNGLIFGILSPETIRDISRVKVDTQDLLEGSEAKLGGLLDERLGTLDRSKDCQTCLANNKDCPGHFGHIEFAKPIYNYGYIQYILDTLRCICPHCSRFLISKRDKFWKKLQVISNPKLRVRAIIKYTKNMTKCFYHPAIKGDPPEGCGKLLAIYKYGENVRITAEFPNIYPEFSNFEKFLITPEKVRRIFEKIDSSDYPILGFSYEYARPQWMIFTAFPVPPPHLRPSNRSNAAARQESDKTKKLLDIIHYNKILKQTVDDLEKVKYDNTIAKQKGGRVKDEEKLLDLVLVHTHVLQIHVSLYLDSKSVNQQQKFIKSNNKKTKGAAQDLSQKEGRFRGNLMGKRTDFSGRTVISPDPFIGLSDVVVPSSIAINLTKKVYVNRFNIKELESMVENGPFEVWGANSVILQNGDIMNLKFAKKEDVLPLQYGMQVERHMKNGDIVSFNRQPSLHRMSIMAHKAVIKPYSTFRPNPSAVTPYNADFDGDEMNLILEQNMESEVELSQLMLVEKNFLSPQNGRPCMGVIQDTLLGARLITMRNVFLEKEQVMQLLCFLQRWNGILPQPAILKPKPLWTGKQIISCTLPALNHTHYCLDFPSSEKDTLIMGHRAENLSPTDTKLIIRGGQILCGHLCKKTVGASHNSLIHILLKDYGSDINREFIEDLQEVTRLYIGIRGFTIGNQDMSVDPEIRKKSKAAVKIIEDHMEKWKKEKIPSQEYETRVNKMMNDARGNIAKDLMSKLPLLNNFKLILTAGSKGTQVNPTQIMVCIGQNNVEGKRIQNSFTNRICPHVQQFDDSPVPKGFGLNCLMNGLTPMEYWNYTMAGREGLIDTAVKTCETGYLQRRLCKAMEDLGVQYDGTVRNSFGSVILFASGEDGFDGSYLEFHDFIPFQMPYEKYQDVYFWKDSSILTEMEKNRLQNDWNELQKHREVYKNFSSPVNFKRILDNIPFIKKECDLTRERVIKDIVQLQSRLWKNIPQIEIPWDTKFAMLLRSILASKRVLNEYKLDSDNWRWILERIEKNYVKSLAQPGDMVGSIAGQSLGEPSTQMTLNVFHFVGISEKNIPLGVPRLKELINNAKETKNPSLTIFLKKSIRYGSLENYIQIGENINNLVSQFILKNKNIREELIYNLDSLSKCHVSEIITNCTLMKNTISKIESTIQHEDDCATKILEENIVSINNNLSQLISNENEKFVTKFAKSIKEKYFKDIIDIEEIIYDPDIQTTVIQEDQHMVYSFNQIPECLEKREGIEWTQYLIRFELMKDKMIELEITIQDVVNSLRQIWDKTLYIEYTSEYSDKCILRIRAIIEKKTKPVPGEDYYLMLELLKYMKNNVIVAGIEGIRKTFPKKVTAYDGRKEFIIETEGTNLRDILANFYVDGERTFSNDINEINDVLGIEAATSSIIREITQVLKFYDIYVDYRHPCLLANLMCNRDKIMGMTRHGLNKAESGPLIKASFEETSEVLLEGARFFQEDKLKGVSPAIMVGMIPPIGTGKFTLFLDTNKLDNTMDISPELIPQNIPIIHPLKENVFEKTSARVNDMLSSLRMKYEMDDLDIYMSMENSPKRMHLEKPITQFNYSIKENTDWMSDFI